MTTFEEAYKIVISSAKELNKETVTLDNALNRVLYEDVFADMDMPPFDKSAMDGYACRMQDISNRLEVLETVAAGGICTKIIGQNQCIRIMTGARIPEGADTVIMVEYTKDINENCIEFTGKETATNIVYQGEDLKKNDLLLQKKIMLKPQHIAVLASAGYYKPNVYRQTRVGVIATGDELVEPFVIPGPSQIRNSNAYQLINQVKAAHAIANYYGIAKDDKEITETIINKAVSENDVVILSGGVSMGDFDFVPEILVRNNIKILFDRLNVKPGRATVFGIKENKYIFGLPGNPVSNFVIFEMLSKPLLLALMGYNIKPSYIPMHMEKDYKRKKADRLTWIPVRFTGNDTVDFVEYHGSAHVHSLISADALVEVPAGVSEIKKGEIVHVRLI